MTPPKNIGKYRIERVLGTGTFATVYLAYDPDLDSYCAVKVLAEQWSEDESARSWFLNEARWMFGIDHTRILRVFTSGTTESGRPFFVMEYADQGNLADFIRDRRVTGRGFTLKEALEISLEIAEGLVVAHNHGIVHRDLKPRNILLRSQPVWGFRSATTDPSGNTRFEIKLADFGLARQLEKGTYSLANAGTPLYMAPEQLRAALEDHPDPRSDVYAAATILYELLTLRVPFPYQSPGQIISAHLTEDPPPIRTLRPSIPQPIADLVHQGLRKNPDRRFASALAWKNALQHHADITSEDEQPDDEEMPQPVEASEVGESTDRVNKASTALAAGELSFPQYIETTHINNQPTLFVETGSEAKAETAEEEQPAYRERVFNPERQTVITVPRWSVYLGGLAGLIGMIGLLSMFLLGLPSDDDSSGNSNITAMETPTEEPQPTATPEPEPSPTPEPTPTEVEPTSEPEPTETPDATGFGPEDDAQIRASLERLPGLSSSVVIDSMGGRIGHSADRQVPSASIIKLWIAAAGYDAVVNGDLDFSDVYTVSGADQVGGTGILNRADYVGRDVRVSDLLEMMLLYSDNTAANIVTELIGGMERVNSYAAENGYESTQMQRMLGQLDPNRENYTSAMDTGLFFERLLNDEIVDEETSRQIRDILQRRHANENDQVNFFGRELPETTAYAHISGLLPNVRNEAGYFITDDGDPVVVVVLLDNLPSEEAGMESIGRAVFEVYEHVN